MNFTHKNVVIPAPRIPYQYVSPDAVPSGVEYLDDLPPETKYRVFYGRGEKKYAVYPTGWSFKRYGKQAFHRMETVVPLGYVFADNEFLAARRACDLGMNPALSGLPVVVEVSTPPVKKQNS